MNQTPIRPLRRSLRSKNPSHNYLAYIKEFITPQKTIKNHSPMSKYSKKQVKLPISSANALHCLRSDSKVLRVKVEPKEQQSTNNLKHVMGKCTTLLPSQEKYVKLMNYPLVRDILPWMQCAYYALYTLYKDPSSLIFHDIDKIESEKALSMFVIRGKLNTGYYQSMEQFSQEVERMIQGKQQYLERQRQMKERQNTLEEELEKEQTDCVVKNIGKVFEQTINYFQQGSFINSLNNIRKYYEEKYPEQLQRYYYKPTPPILFGDIISKQIKLLNLRDKFKSLPCQSQRQLSEVIKECQQMQQLFKIDFAKLQMSTIRKVQDIIQEWGSTHITKQPNKQSYTEQQSDFDIENSSQQND